MCPPRSGQQTVWRCARILCWLLPAGLSLAAVLHAGQEPAIDEGPPAPRSEAPEKSATEGRPPATANGPPVVPAGPLDLKYLEGADGRPVYVPDRLRLADFLNWVAEREAGGDRAPPDFSISSLSFDGRADDERAFLTAVVDLELASENRWVRVPVLMPEATLRSPAVYTGKGRAVSAPWHPEQGYTWWINGKGTHQLKLSLSIPLRKQAGQRRIQLSLPPTAVSVLKLRIAAPHISASAPEFSNLSTRTIGQETEIEVIGLRNRLDVAWKTLPELNGAPTPLEVTTAVLATLVDGEAATLEATQLIQSLGQQGTFDRLHVALPAGYKLQRLEGPELREQKSDPANPNQIVVQLKKPTSGPVELKWTVQSTLPAVGEPFGLEGFDVEQARLQTGYLAVVVVGDFRMDRQPDEDKFLQRVDLVDLPASLRQTPATAAYRFLNRLLLRMKLQRVEPFVTVDPGLVLHLASDGLELEGVYRLQVLRGSISGVRLHWPGWKQQGWAITEAELPGHIELRTMDEGGDADVVRFELPEPVKDKDPVELRFRARRPLVTGAGRVFLTVPVPASYGRVPTALAVVAADNLEADLRGVEPTLLRPVGVPDPRVVVPAEWQPLKRSDWRLESLQSALSLGLSVYPRKIQGSTQIDASIGRSAVTIRQTIVYDVAYERLPQLRFAILEGVPPEQLRFFLRTRAGTRELLTQIAPSTGELPAEIRAPLDAPAIGRFEVEIRYALGRAAAAPDARDALLSIPLVQSNDMTFTSTRFSCRDAAGRDAVVEGPGWVRQLDADGRSVWMLTEGPSQVTVRVAHQAGALHGALVSKALIRTAVDGTSRSWAQYQLAGGISELSLAFPTHLKPLHFWWNRTPLPVEPAASSADNSTTWYEIAIPAGAAEGQRLLTVEYLASTPAPSRFSAAYALEVPWLADDESPAEVRWQVELPRHQHLFTEPFGFAPEYRWQSGRLFLSREPESSVADLEAWIGAAAGPSDVAGGGDGNRYVFGTFGPPPELAFRAMSQSGIVLIGAGTALFLGLVLVKWTVLRHILTLLTAAFVVALLGVWYAAPVQVLLQPAALGLGLAVIAAGIDSYVKRRSRPVTVTIMSSSGMLSSGSSAPRGPVAAVGSNEFTSVRSPAPVARAARPFSDSGKLSESGNRT